MVRHTVTAMHTDTAIHRQTSILPNPELSSFPMTASQACGTTLIT